MKFSFIITLLFIFFGFSELSIAQEMQEEYPYEDAYDEALRLKIQIEKSVQLADRELLRDSIEGFDHLIKIDSLRMHAYYYMSYGWYTLYNYSTDEVYSEKVMPEYLKKAIRYGEKALEIDENYIEALTIIGNAHAITANGRLLKKLKRARRAKKYMDRAAGIDKNNPRFVMYDGVGTLFKPMVVGGSKEKGLKILLKAKPLFKAYQPENELDPTWGEAELYAWIGQAYEMNKDPKNAKLAYEQSLELNPEYGWVKDKLLPDLIANYNLDN